MDFRRHTSGSLVALLSSLALAACGGDDAAPAQAPAPPPPPPGTLIGAAGGTVAGPNGSSVVIPAAALANDTRINIEVSPAGAPPLPGGFTAHGQTFAFTPHGTTFAVPVTVTLPFDAASVPPGGTPAFYKTNAQTQWEQVPNATFGATSVSAQVTSFSFAEIVLPPPLIPGQVVRQWSFSEYRGAGLELFELDTGSALAGDVSEIYDFGGAFFDSTFFVLDGSVVPEDKIASGVVGSSADGTRMLVGAEAPAGDANADNDPLGSEVRLVQGQSFTKVRDDATLSITVPGAFLEVRDQNRVLGRVCPEIYAEGLLGELCPLIKAEIGIDAVAYDNDRRTIHWTNAGAVLEGFAGSWDSQAWTAGRSRTPLWTTGDFDFVIEDSDGAPEAHVTMALNGPHSRAVNLDSIEVGEAFHVQIVVTAYAHNRIAGAPSEFPTSAGAYLNVRPLSGGGPTLVFTGLDPFDPPVAVPPPEDVPVLPALCAPGPGSEPAAGVLQFGAASYVTAESSTTPTISVTRTDGSTGDVTATFTTSDGTAVAPADYTAVNSTVFFADGDASPRVVRVPIVQNQSGGEPAKTVNLTLSQPGGCATLGTQDTALLTIRDDDPPPPTPAFTVGGTVTGLVGTGLRLQDLHLVPITPGNGPFTFTLPTEAGQPYAVSVVTQPNNPIQVCTVSNSSGTMADANVTNVAVSCVTPTASGALDAGFNGTGTVSTAFGGDETAMALQADGKILMVGGSGSDFVLARYDTDGTLDENFGDAGTVTTDIGGGADAAYGVAVQPDGRIVVVGRARVAANDDFAIVRYEPDGDVDTGFGTLGKVTTDIDGGQDRAYAVAIQPDNGMVVVGYAARVPGGTDFAVARYDATGAPVVSFDFDGKLTTDVGGAVDIARHVVLQGSAGEILVLGQLTLGGSPSLGHAGLARYQANGALDPTFGIAGLLTLPGLAVGEGLALQSDGKIVLAGNAPVAGDTVFAALRLTADGGTDGSFANGSIATAGFTTNDDYGHAVAVDSDGRILVAGQSSNLSNPNFAVARFRGDGTLDDSFDVDGRFTIDFFGSFDGAESVAVQTDGKIVLGGFARNGATTGYGLVRINP